MTTPSPETPEPDITCEFCDSKGPESSMTYSDDGYVCKRCYSAAQEAFNREWQILEVGELILATDEWHDGENWGPSSRIGEEVREGDEGDYRRRRVATRTAPEAVAGEEWPNHEGCSVTTVITTHPSPISGKPGRKLVNCGC